MTAPEPSPKVLRERLLRDEINNDINDFLFSELVAQLMPEIFQANHTD
jgi:hypothetical protein